MSLLKLDPNFKPSFDGHALAQGLVNKILRALPICQAYLFGSCAEGKNTTDSDIDILLIVPDSANVKEYYQFVNAPFFSEVAVDWIIKTSTDFEKNKSIGGIAMIASQNGIELKINGSK
ncbi:MAG: nucleotidyltransferase domain-containing protein [Bdellovibrio sp.]|nr:nucleotidyltransferase domain-containing protein [Bdellovibrio sp.]